MVGEELPLRPLAARERKRRRAAIAAKAVKELRSDSRPLPDRKNLLEVVGGTRNDVDADQLADAAGGGRSGIGRGLHRTHVAANERRDQAGIDLLPAHEHDVRGLEHRVGRFDHADQPARLDHAERVADVCLVLRHGRDLTTPSCAAVR